MEFFFWVTGALVAASLLTRLYDLVTAWIDSKIREFRER